jgi:chemotaxis protein methyltransferase CheR
MSEFDFIKELVFSRSAIVLEPGKEYLVESRLVPVARDHGVESLAELVDTLRARPSSALLEQVVEAMTTNETSFFRDVRPFEAFRSVVMPSVLEQRGTERTLTIWCAASSSGQEPYSVALLLAEHFPELADWDVHILATDLSREMVERTQAGAYSQLEVNRGLPATLLVKYFRRQGSSWTLDESIRSMVECREMNLVETWPALAPCDAIFLRNVLIYFDPETKRDLLDRAHRLLRPDGFLFLGGAETTLNLHEGYERVPFERAGCYRRIDAIAEGPSARGATVRSMTDLPSEYRRNAGACD